MRATVIAAMLAAAAVLITSGSEPVAANEYSLMDALKITEKLMDRFRGFARVERGRRHLPCNGCDDWYGSLTITGAEWKEALIAHTEIVGSSFRVNLPKGSIDTTMGVSETGTWPFGSLVADVLWTKRSEKIPGFNAYTTHFFGKKRGWAISPPGCASVYLQTAPSDLFEQGFNSYLSGARNGGNCGYGPVDGYYGYRPPRREPSRERGGMEGRGGVH